MAISMVCGISLLDFRTIVPVADACTGGCEYGYGCVWVRVSCMWFIVTKSRLLISSGLSKALKPRSALP